MCCGVAAIVLKVLLIWPVMLHQRLHLTKKNKKNKHAGTETGVQDGPALPAIFCDVIMSATIVGRVCYARAPLKVPTEPKK